jgi:hypothetical protein
MPWIDLSFVTLDPSIANIPFRVYRRQETVNDLGRSETTVETIDCVGGVFPTGSNTLKRDPMRDFSERGITIISRFRLQLTSIGYKPDLVEWPINSKNLWLVNFVNDYSQYGAGFTEAQLVFFDPEHFDHSAA